MQDSSCTEETILKEHIRLLEVRVKELVSQNFKLVSQLTKAEEHGIRNRTKENQQVNTKPYNQPSQTKSVPPVPRQADRVAGFVTP